MKPGTKVLIKVGTWWADANATGVVYDKNFKEGLISVQYDDGPIFDFDSSFLEEFGRE